MKIVVFGATGRVGRAVVEQGLGRGHEITAFVRSPAKLDRAEAPSLTVVVGDASDPTSVAAAIAGHDAVISALGVATLDETTELSTMNANVIEGAKAVNVSSVVTVVSVAVFFKTSRPPFQFVGEEHRRDLAGLRASGLSWVGAAPGVITDDDAVGSYEAVLDAPGPGDETRASISRTSCSTQWRPTRSSGTRSVSPTRGSDGGGRGWHDAASPTRGATMPVERSADHPTFEIAGNTFTSLAAPSRGATEAVLFHASVPPGGGLPRHKHDHLDVFTISSGTGTMHIGEGSWEVSEGDSVVVPAGEWHFIEGGAEGISIVVTMLAGTLMIREDGTHGVPAWNE